MISHLHGRVIVSEEKAVVLDVSGVGYRVATTPHIALAAKIGQEISLWTHLAVKENALELYGFENRDDLALFDLLMTVSGIGPKTALGVLCVVDAQTIRIAISTQDTSYLTKVSGVGKKMAEKIIHELKGSFEGLVADSAMKEDHDALEALQALGYSQSEARDALKLVSKEATSTGARVKEALKHLGKK